MSMIVNPFWLALAGPGASGQQLWLRAKDITGLIDDDEISTWNDSSGNGRHASGIVNNTLKPTYRASDGPGGDPAVRFQNVATNEGGAFTLPDFLSGSGWTEGHAFVVAKNDLDPPIVNSRAGPLLGDWGNNAVGEFYQFPADSVIYDGLGSTVRHTTVNPTPATNVWHVYEVRVSAGHWSNYIDGVQLFTTATNTIGWGAGPKVGWRTSSATATYYGLQAEVLFYNEIKSGGNLTTIYDYLELEHGITLP